MTWSLENNHDQVFLRAVFPILVVLTTREPNAMDQLKEVVDAGVLVDHLKLAPFSSVSASSFSAYQYHIFALCSICSHYIVSLTHAHIDAHTRSHKR